MCVSYRSSFSFLYNEIWKGYVPAVVLFGDDEYPLVFVLVFFHRPHAVFHQFGHLLLALQPAEPQAFGGGGQRTECFYAETVHRLSLSGLSAYLTLCRHDFTGTIAEMSVQKNFNMPVFRLFILV